MRRERERPKFTIDTRATNLGMIGSFQSPITPPKEAQMGDTLQHVGLTEFFDLEVNPVLVFDTTEHTPTYENHAFQEWKRGSPRECLAFSQPSFLDWVMEFSKSMSGGDFTIAGRTWRTSMLRKRWMILTSHERQVMSAIHGQTVPPTPPANITPAPSFSANEAPLAIQRNSGRYSPALSFSSSSSTMDNIHPGQKPLDWTRYHVPGLTSHQQTIKNFAWQSTSMGGMDTWSDTLRSVVIALNANPEPRILLWGPDHVLIPNEACAPVLASKFPQSIGGKGEDIWSEAWPALAGFIARTESEAKATRIPIMPLPMYRNGYDEETFWTINFVPIVGSKGRVAGVLDEFTETTHSVVSDRRRDIIVKTSEALARISTLEELWDGFLKGIERATEDIPYAVIYTPTGSTHSNPKGVNTPSEPPHHFSMRGSVGFDPAAFPLPSSFDLNATATAENGLLQACKKAWKTGDTIVLQSKDGSLPTNLAVGVPNRAAGATVNTAVLVPVPDLMGNDQLAFVLLSLTPRRPIDDNATLLFRSLSDVLTRAASTIFLPDEQRRARQKFEEIETSLSQQLKSASLEAEKAEARYEKILKSAQVGMYIIRADEKLLYYNDAYLACTGATKEQAESSDLPANLIHDEDRERVYASWHHCLTEKTSITLEYRMKKPWVSIEPASGREIHGDTWILSSAAPELDDQGNAIHVMGWMLDISDRKYHERQYIQRLEEEQAEVRFARLAETAPMGMYLLKPDGTPIYLNDAYYETLGFTKAQFDDALRRGVGWADQILPEDQHIVTDAWRKLSEDGTPIEITYRVKKPWRAYDNASKTQMAGPTWLQGTAFAEKDEAGNVVAVQGFVTDISLKKFSERLLTERLEEALETKRSADRFIDMVSHEMRNPLSAILQSADGILTALNVDPHSRSHSLGHTMTMTADVVETVTDASQTIMLCAQHQKRIVDDILTLSKLDSNLLVISPDRVNVPILIEKCFKMYEGELERADIDASLEIEQGYQDLAVDCVMIDSSRVLQVIINLLTNAIKFTQHSAERKIKIFLDASMTEPKRSNHKAPWVEARAHRPNHTSAAEWGTGQEMYLQFAVQDTGKGLTEQELKLMFNRFSQASPKTYKQYGGSGLGLFISRELTELQGGQIGVHSEADVGSIFTFYVKARRAADDGPTTTPGLLTRTASSNSTSRSQSNDRKSPAISSRSQPLSRRTSMSLRRGPSLPQIVTNPKTSLHVLVVEDNEINQRVMANQLRRLGCTVYLAGNGVEALNFLETTNIWHSNVYSTEPVAASSPPVSLSCILMDLEMPILGGLGCVKKIREMQSMGKLTRHIPTIAVTANARSEQISVALQHGMDSVVTKPFVIKDLLPLMDELVKKLDSDRRR